MMLPHRNQHGFTLVEALTSLAIGTVFIGSMLSIWIFSSKNFKVEALRTEMRLNMEKALERIKQDARLSDGSNILYYPGAAPYSGISMPAATKDANGFYTFGSAITWDKTIVYHVLASGSTYEFRRTVFNSFSSNDATRQAQLNAVVAAGSDPSGTTTTLFSGSDFSLEIVPDSPSFDGYSAALERSSLTSFGNAVLTPGDHYLRFEITSKNSASSGFQMGFDQFVMSPSGDSAQESEVLPISASSGDASAEEDMSGFALEGTWDGNYQLDYSSNAISDYVEFEIYNDQWIESNFENMAHVDTEVDGTDPKLKVTSRENQSLLPAWKAESQASATEADGTANISNRTIRNIIEAGFINEGAQLVRFKFRAASGGDLYVTAAYFGLRDGGTYNFDSSTQLHFNNGTVEEGLADNDGAVGATGPLFIQIPAGHHAWTNWMEVPIADPAVGDYLISFSVDSAASNGNETEWKPAAAGPNQSYYETGATANAVWTAVDPGLTADDAIHAVQEMSVWTHTGTSTSQIYDTKMAAPTLGDLTWSTNNSGTYSIKVRSAADDEMAGAPDWSAVASFATSPATLASASNRYVQFQATLTTASPYTTYPELDDVTIQWPGQTTAVDFSGVYTKRPSYGMFRVLIDGAALYNALDISLSGTKSLQGEDYVTTVSASIRAKNTGK